MVFLDRLDAGQRLGERLSSLRGPDIVVLGLPRGGVPVAFEVARVLGAPLDVLVVRKLGVPFQPELAMGAIGEDGALVLNHGVMQQIQISRSKFVAIEQREDVYKRQTLAHAANSPLVGADRIVWASDYPHPDAKIPGVTDELRRSIASLTDEQQALIAGGSAVALYDL